jgi:hypothetical protein
MLKIKYAKCQSAIEFVIVTAFLLFFFVLFIVAIQESMSDKVKENQERIVKNLAVIVQDEISMAHSSSNGYKREFKLPSEIASKDYEIKIVQGSIYVKSDRAAIALPIAEVQGDIEKGVNIIRKENGYVLLNK